MDIKIGQNGSEVVFKAGYLNRAALNALLEKGEEK